jgi:hypothetical protein
MSTKTSPAQVADELDSLASSSDAGSDWFILENSDAIPGQNSVNAIHHGNAESSANINSNDANDLQSVDSDVSALGKSLFAQRDLFMR